MTTENSAAKIAELAVHAAGKPAVVTSDDKREYILHPPQWVAKEIPTLPQNVIPPIPKWTSQIVRLQNEVSLTAYVNRFKNPDTVIFADITTDTVVGVIDYHREAHAGQPGEDSSVGISTGYVQACLKAHKAILKLPRSIEWTTWIEKDEEEMTQLEFVSFLEDNAVDISEPDGAGLLELCRDIEGTRNVKFGASVRAGSVDNIEYVKESGAQTKGKLSLPKEFTLLIPVYFGDEEINLTALLRRRVDGDGGLTLWYKLLRPENVRQNRFQEIVARIQSETGELTTIYGTAD